jgi:hypothetical protein
MFAHNDGTFVINPVTAETSCILLSTAISDTLVLSEFGDGGEPYNRTRQDFAKSSGRSLVGSIRVTGGYYVPPLFWELNFMVNIAQLELLESFLVGQKTGMVSIVDRWRVPLGEAAVTKPVWIDVDSKYATPRGIDYLLQFAASEVL